MTSNKPFKIKGVNHSSVAVISVPDRNNLQGGRFIWAHSCKGSQSITGKERWDSLVHSRVGVGAVYSTADQERARLVVELAETTFKGSRQ